MAQDTEFLPLFEFAFEARVHVEPGIHIGRSIDEKLLFFAITGGTVTGPLLNGEVVPGGGDWCVERSGTIQLDARYLIKTDDGAYLDIHNRGYFRAAPEVQERLMSGEKVDESEYYFRTAAVFQTDAPQHRWLAENQLIGLARDDNHDICIRFFVLR